MTVLLVWNCLNNSSENCNTFWQSDTNKDVIIWRSWSIKNCHGWRCLTHDYSELLPPQPHHDRKGVLINLYSSFQSVFISGKGWSDGNYTGQLPSKVTTESYSRNMILRKLPYKSNPGTNEESYSEKSSTGKIYLKNSWKMKKKYKINWETVMR